MARSIHRSAGSGRFVSKAAVARWPGKTTTEQVGSGTGNSRTVHRSASSGQVPSRGVFLGGQGQGSGGAVEEGVDEAAHGGFGEVAAFALGRVSLCVKPEGDRA